VSGFGELIKQGLKSAGKAMVKKGGTVSSKKKIMALLKKSTLTQKLLLYNLKMEK